MLRICVSHKISVLVIVLQPTEHSFLQGQSEKPTVGCTKMPKDENTVAA